MPSTSSPSTAGPWRSTTLPGTAGSFRRCTGHQQLELQFPERRPRRRHRELRPGRHGDRQGRKPELDLLPHRRRDDLQRRRALSAVEEVAALMPAAARSGRSSVTADPARCRPAPPRSPCGSTRGSTCRSSTSTTPTRAEPSRRTCSLRRPRRSAWSPTTPRASTSAPSRSSSTAARGVRGHDRWNGPRGALGAQPLEPRAPGTTRCSCGPATPGAQGYSVGHFSIDAGAPTVRDHLPDAGRLPQLDLVHDHGHGDQRRHRDGACR